jgi:serine/threonine protein kinase
VTLRDPQATPPKSIGPYRILRTLGEGGMGVVYAARDTRLERDVALKMIRAASADPQSRGRMWREARAAARVSHPNVCQLFDVGEEQGELFIAMELMDGEPLSARIARGALPVQEASDVALGVLAALEALHRNGVVHRDLKPSNVFLTAHGVKLLDFGLARWLDAEAGADDVTLTQPGMVFGTPRYMAPEQWSHGAVGPGADLFAAGAILFEMLTGRPAFSGSSPIEIFQAIAREQGPALAGDAPVMAIDRVIQKALAKRPERRYGSAADMAHALREAIQDVDSRGSVRVQAVTRLIALPLRVLRSDAETDFLAFSLPDAITASLSGLSSMVVRSSALAARFDAVQPDLEAIAVEADVDVVLVGTLLRAGDQVRVTSQLVEAPSGTLQWSNTAQVPLRDLFQLQDDLTHRIVESLSLPLSARDRRLLQQDIPASARAYELYLRANEVAKERSAFRVARDLYRSCLDEDPNYAPAWARYARMCRVIAKYAEDDVTANYRNAEEAFARALDLNPDLPLAHNLYTYFEVEDLGRSTAAIARLLAQARTRPSDPELYAGLVVACRYGGLLDASLAADRRARRLDPAIRTSVSYTHWMRGDYTLAMEHDRDEPRYMQLYALPMLGRAEEAIAFIDRLEAGPMPPMLYRELTQLRCAIQGRPLERALELEDLLGTGFRDPEGIYFVLRNAVRVGHLEPALRMLESVVTRGYHCVETLRTDPWLSALRDRPEFAGWLVRAEEGRRASAAAFREGGGEALLGIAAP